LRRKPSYADSEIIDVVGHGHVIDIVGRSIWPNVQFDLDCYLGNWFGSFCGSLCHTNYGITPFSRTLLGTDYLPFS